MTQAERERRAQNVAVKFDQAMSAYMIDLIAAAIEKAEFSKETFFSFLKTEMNVERIEDLRKEQFMPVCQMINKLNDQMQ